MKKRSKSKKKSPTKCKSYLKKLISLNMGEYKNGKFKSRSQAIAISYNQAIKRFPRCKQHLSRKKSSKKRSKSTHGKCREYLQKKIAINMEEYKQGRFVSPSQAVAVSYAMVLKKYPHCKRFLKLRKSKRSSKKI